MQYKIKKFANDHDIAYSWITFSKVLSRDLRQLNLMHDSLHWQLLNICIEFFKTLFKGKNFAVRRVRLERGKFDFDHYFALLTNFLKI